MTASQSGTVGSAHAQESRTRGGDRRGGAAEARWAARHGSAAAVLAGDAGRARVSLCEEGLGAEEEAQESSSISSLSDLHRSEWSVCTSVSSLDGQELHHKMAEFTGGLQEDLKRQIQLKRLKRELKHQLIEFVIYLAFLLTFTFVMLGIRDPLYSFQYNELMKDLILDEEFPEPEIYKTFYDVATFEEFWEYMNDVLIPGWFADQGGLGPNYIYGQNVIVGTARVRQVRVKPGSCPALETPFDQVFRREECFGRVTDQRTSKDSFGPDLQYYYQDSDDINNQRYLLGFFQFYDGGGFLEEFSPADDYDHHAEHMANLTANNWVDLQTRAVFIDFTTYNAAVNLFHNGEMIFEFLPSGGVHPSKTFRVMRLYKYADNNAGRAHMAGEIILMIFVFAYIAQEVYELFRHGCKGYLTNVWNYLDWINNLLFLAAFTVRIIIVVRFENMGLDTTQQRRFFQFHTLSTLNSTENNLLALNSFMLWLKIFKYTSFIPAMRVISLAAARSIKNTIGFIILFAFVLFGFAQAGVLAFGADVEEFRNFNQTFFTLLRAMLGDFDFESMQYSNRTFGPLFFLVYMVLVFFILLSMFLAILNDSYLAVQAEERQNKQLNVVSLAHEWFQKKADEFHLHEGDDEDLINAINAADLDDDDLLSPIEIEDIFHEYEQQARAVLGVTSAEEFMDQFDVDGDRQLNKAEQLVLIKSIEDWRKEAELRRVKALGGDSTLAQANLEHLASSDLSSYIVSLKQDIASFREITNRFQDNLNILINDLDINPADANKPSQDDLGVDPFDGIDQFAADDEASDEPQFKRLDSKFVKDTKKKNRSKFKSFIPDMSKLK